MNPCTCTNPQCPNARQYSGCAHCMCLTVPDFEPGETIGYSGQISQQCCKCGYLILISGSITGSGIAP